MTDLENLTLKSILKRSAALFPDNAALAKIDEAPITYTELFDRVENLSHFLHKQGIVMGDRVAILSESKSNWGIAYLAITTMGAIAVPILPDFHAAAVQHIIRHSECKAIFISEQQYEKIEDVKFENLNSIILIDDFQAILPDAKKDIFEEVVKEGKKEFAKIKKATLKLAGKIPGNVQEDDIASIVYTSGTTGHSKGVMLTHKNIVSNAIATVEIVPVTEHERLLSILPLSHTYECTLGFVIPIMQGCCIYYLDKAPTPRVLMQALAKIKPTMMLSVPLVIEKIYKIRVLPQFSSNKLMRKLYQLPAVRKRLHRLAGKKLFKSFGGQLHFFGLGGAGVTPEVENFLREANFPYSIGYGLTETSPLIAGSLPEKTKYRSTGPVIPGVKVKIDNPDPTTHEGEILVKGPNVMKGYYKDPERTADVFTEDGWFRTGDLGVFDKQDYLYIKGRLKNVIIGSSGENIYPEEIESILNDFEYVLESIVFQQQGKLAARVYLNYEWLDQKLDCRKQSDSQIALCIKELLEELRHQVNTKVSSFARISKIIEQPEPFEKTPTQKIKRYLYVEE